MSVELIVFDMAGTTVHDSDNVHEALISALARFGHTINREHANSVMGIPKPVAIHTLLTTTLHLTPSAQDIDAIFQEFGTIMRHHYATSPDVRPTPSAERTLHTLRTLGIKVALNTGFSSDITKIIIDRLQWQDVIDGWVGADQVPQGRPHPDMIQFLMQTFGIKDPARVAKVGDTPADLHEGTNADCGWVIGLTSGSHTRTELEAHPHTHLVDDLWDVVQAISSQPASGPKSGN